MKKALLHKVLGRHLITTAIVIRSSLRRLGSKLSFRVTILGHEEALPQATLTSSSVNVTCMANHQKDVLEAARHSRRELDLGSPTTNEV